MKAPDFEQEFSRHNEFYYEPARMPRPVQLVVLNGELVALGDNGTIWRRVPVVTPWQASNTSFGYSRTSRVEVGAVAVRVGGRNEA